LDGRQRKLIVGDSSGLLAVVDHVEGKCSKALDPHAPQKVKAHATGRKAATINPPLPPSERVAVAQTGSAQLGVTSPNFGGVAGGNVPPTLTALEMAQAEYEQEQSSVPASLGMVGHQHLLEMQRYEVERQLDDSALLPPLHANHFGGTGNVQATTNALLAAGVPADGDFLTTAAATAATAATAAAGTVRSNSGMVDDCDEEHQALARAAHRAQTSMLAPKLVSLCYCASDRTVVSAAGNGVVQVCDEGSKHAQRGYHVTVPNAANSILAQQKPPQSVLLRSIVIGDTPNFLHDEADTADAGSNDDASSAVSTLLGAHARARDRAHAGGSRVGDGGSTVSSDGLGISTAMMHLGGAKTVVVSPLGGRRFDVSSVLVRTAPEGYDYVVSGDDDMMTVARQQQQGVSMPRVTAAASTAASSTAAAAAASAAAADSMYSTGNSIDMDLSSVSACTAGGQAATRGMTGKTSAASAAVGGSGRAHDKGGNAKLDHAELQQCALSHHLNMLLTVTNR
jgi:hypothetical protein